MEAVNGLVVRDAPDVGALMRRECAGEGGIDQVACIWCYAGPAALARVEAVMGNEGGRVEATYGEVVVVQCCRWSQGYWGGGVFGSEEVALLGVITYFGCVVVCGGGGRGGVCGCGSGV